jgi:hypothetical protein
LNSYCLCASVLTVATTPFASLLFLATLGQSEQKDLFLKN